MDSHITDACFVPEVCQNELDQSRYSVSLCLCYRRRGRGEWAWPLRSMMALAMSGLGLMTYVKSFAVGALFFVVGLIVVLASIVVFAHIRFRQSISLDIRLLWSPQVLVWSGVCFLIGFAFELWRSARA